MTLQPLLSTESVSEILGVSPGTIRALVADKGLPAVRIGRILRFKPADVDAWLDTQKEVAPAPKILYPSFSEAVR